MDRVRDLKRGDLLRKALVLVGLHHHEMPRFCSPMSSNKKLCTAVDVTIAWTWTRSNETEHALDCSPVIARGMIVGEVGVDRRSRCRLPGLGWSTLAKNTSSASPKPRSSAAFKRR